MLEIVRVVPGSIAEELGLRPGDHIVSINGEAINDVIDYRYRRRRADLPDGEKKGRRGKDHPGQEAC